MNRRLNSNKQLPSKLKTVTSGLTLTGLILMIISYVIFPRRAAFNNLWIFSFVLSIALGSLFWVALEYLAGAVWSVPFRRVPEFLSANLIILPIIALPLFYNFNSLFEWANPALMKNDPELHSKLFYLNISSFNLREIIFFIIWLLFFVFLLRNSLRQDSTSDNKLTKFNIRLSAIFMPLFAFSISFASFDWLMSLEPHWFSTIFGVYYFAGTALASMAFITILVIYLGRRGCFFEKITADHYYSFGALMFAFVNFWAYIAFSQFLLIWYGNLPEETIWFLQRWQGNWVYFSIGLIFIQFAIPYFMLLSQPSKMNPKRLLFAAWWLIFAHIYDLYWMVFPAFSKSSAPFGFTEIGALLFMIGLVLLVFYLFANNKNLLPVGDPKLKRGINFKL